jgi:hypothetical protein
MSETRLTAKNCGLRGGLNRMRRAPARQDFRFTKWRPRLAEMAVVGLEPTTHGL